MADSSDYQKYAEHLSAQLGGKPASYDAAMQSGAIALAAAHLAYGLVRVAEAIEAHTKAQSTRDFCFGAWDRAPR